MDRGVKTMANVPEPKTREELYLAKAAGKSVDTPTPETRLEMYLDAISQGGGGGGGGDLPAGGDAGDILAKKSSASGDAGWIKPPYTKEQTDDLLAEKAALSVDKISTAGGGEEVHAIVSQGDDTVGLNYYKQGQEPPDYINLNVGDDYFTFETRDGIRKQIAQKPSMSLEPEDNTVTFGTDTELFSVTEETDDVLIQMAIPGEYETEFRVPKSGHVDALLSGKQDIVQFTVVPEASADNEGKVIQFVGATSQTFTNGFFYRCQEVTPATDPKTFEWVRVDVQPASGGACVFVIDTANPCSFNELQSAINASKVILLKHEGNIYPFVEKWEIDEGTKRYVNIASLQRQGVDKGAFYLFFEAVIDDFDSPMTYSSSFTQPTGKPYADKIAGDLSALDTTEKDNLVGAVNEVNGKLGVNIEVNAEIWYGTYTDENGVTYQVYTKTIYIPALAAAAGATTYPHGISGIKQILSAYGFTTDGFVMNAPRQNVADNISIYQVQKAGGVVIEVGKDRSSKKAYVTLIYAKGN